jgi:geranylgeranyl diphosphate synthase type I
MGYVLSGGSGRNELKAIEEFGVPLGVAFQSRDHILGVFGIESDTGKPNDSDIHEGKFTLLIHNTMQKLDSGELDKFKSVLLSQSKSTTDVDYIRGAIKNSGALTETIDSHRKLIAEAEEKLDELRIRSYNREFLRGVVESIEDIPI